MNNRMEEPKQPLTSFTPVPVRARRHAPSFALLARTRMGSLRLLRFDLPSRARARVPLPTLATFVPRKSRRHCEHSRRFEMWSRAWAR